MDAINKRLTHTALLETALLDLHRPASLFSIGSAFFVCGALASSVEKYFLGDKGKRNSAQRLFFQYAALNMRTIMAIVLFNYTFNLVLTHQRAENETFGKPRTEVDIAFSKEESELYQIAEPEPQHSEGVLQRSVAVTNSKYPKAVTENPRAEPGPQYSAIDYHVRVIDRHKTLIAFKELIVPVFAALKHQSEHERDETPDNLLTMLSTFESMFSLVVSVKIAGLLKHLGQILQATDLDLIAANSEIMTTKKTLKSLLSMELFNGLFDETVSLCNNIDKTLSMSIYDNRRNAERTQFCQSLIYEPYINNLIDEIDARFSVRQQVSFSLQLLIPHRCKKLSYEAISQAVEQYSAFLPNLESLDTEIMRWKNNWSSGERPNNVLETIQIFDDVLQSTLKRIFSDYRASMEPSRLSNLAVCSVYTVLLEELDLEDIIDKFANNSNPYLRCRGSPVAGQLVELRKKDKPKDKLLDRRDTDKDGMVDLGGHDDDDDGIVTYISIKHTCHPRPSCVYCTSKFKVPQERTCKGPCSEDKYWGVGIELTAYECHCHQPQKSLKYWRDE
ncbi:transthyretin-like family domain-containing protein [Ditylenchus destructor]|uniref:Transthyretin-like family domain-containing protein n=1 Tax=Ditylenchus destructor TaxID=166010 RepID=A0AAD4MQE4_9BILA|nr:transthyretin-like family domain-containing protein [Ditylenchus destructor]